jgi:hypothetical protein
MAQILGNAGPGFPKSIRTGSGINSRRAPFGHITISGQAGEVVRISTADLYPKFDQLFQGIIVQAVGGSVKVDTTLAEIDLALSPDQDEAGHWILDTTAVPGKIMPLQNMATVLKITFVSDAILYIMGV